MNLKRFFFPLLFLFLANSLPAQFLNWEYINITDDPRESGVNPDVAFDATGGIHVTCWNSTEDKLQYFYRASASTSWAREYVSISSANGFKSAITLSSSGVPHVAYLENVAGIMQMRYAVRTGAGIWAIEVIPGDPLVGWGQYGPIAPMVQSERIKNSVDIVLDAAGEPHIVFFDGWWIQNLTPPLVNCTLPYGLKPWQATKIGGNWVVKKMGVIDGVHVNCTPDSVLSHGDRVGEFMSLQQDSDGTLHAFTMARFTMNVVEYQTTDDDTTWVYDTVDYASSFLGFPINTASADNLFFTFEGISSNQTPNGFMQVAYTSSMFYGENFCCVGFLDGFGLAQIDTAGAISKHYFTMGSYRNHTSIASQGNDSLYIAYADLTQNQILLKESTDRGVTWTDDTLFNWATNCDLKSQVWNDSLYVTVYNPNADQLLLCARSLDPADSWHVTAITQSRNRGASLDAVVIPQGGDTVAHLGYTDSYLDQLFYAKASASGGWNFTHEQIDATASNVGAVSVASTPSGQGILLYAEGPSGDLKIAIDNGASWDVEIIDTAASVGYTQLALGLNDTIYAVYFAGNTQSLKYARKPLASGTWNIEFIDSANAPTGTYPGLAIDATGRLHVSWHCDSSRSLYYGTRPPNSGAWTIDSLFNTPTSDAGKFSSIAVTSTGLPKIAFLDEIETTVRLAEKSTGGTWTFSAVDSTLSPSNGRPIDLKIDMFDNPWIAYNHNLNYDLVALMHRDTIWHPVNMLTTGHLSQSFSLAIAGPHLFILGKKNEIGDQGLAMLYGPYGIFISNDEPASLLTSLAVYPNPTTGQMKFSLELANQGAVSIQLTNLMGETVAVMVNEEWMPAGNTVLTYDGGWLPNGVYLVSAEAGGQCTTGKIVILR